MRVKSSTVTLTADFSIVIEGVTNHALQENQQTTPEAAFAGNGQLIASFTSLRDQSRYHLNQCHLLNGCEGGQLPLAIETYRDVIW